MACHEIAALRLALMRLLGTDDEAERQHELAELGPAAEAPGPLRSLMQAGDLAAIGRAYAAALADLEERVAAAPADAVDLGYLRTLLVLTRKVELDLDNLTAATTALYRNLEEVHDFVHEIYPGE